MTTIAVVPVTVAPDAAARVAELGMQREFEQMLGKVREIVPYLHSIRVTLEHDPEGEIEPQVVLWAHRSDTEWDKDRSDQELGDWKVRTFPPEVCIQFVLIPLYNDEADYAR